MYRFGLGGVPEDREKAIQWYQRALASPNHKPGVFGDNVKDSLRQLGVSDPH